MTPRQPRTADPNPSRRRIGADSVGPPARYRWFWPAVLGICVVGGLVRFLILSEYLAGNPFAHSPRVDAQTYWTWAGRIAAGQWRETTPFFSAPLYPYLLSLIRVGGGGLTTVYVVQILFDLLTAALLAWIGRARFGAAVGLLSAALFLTMFDPASFCLRVLASSLQLLLIGLVWLALIHFQRSRSLPRAAICGFMLGVSCLATPTMMVLVPLVGAWILWTSERTVSAVRPAAVAIAAAIVAISPATLHNWQASGEFIPVSGHAGLTLYQGNAPGASGVYIKVQGISNRRGQMHHDAARLCRHKTGHSASWGEIDRYYRDQALAYWCSDPIHTGKLFACKAYWFLTGRNYGDIYAPTLEIADNLTSRLRLAPVHTAWLIPPALVAIVALLRRAKVHAPELMLFGTPLLVVMVFWYSPRYRLPVIPVIVVAAAWAIWEALHWRSQRRWSLAVFVSLALAFGLGALNRAVGFDSAAGVLPQFEYSLGGAYIASEDLEQAALHYRKALQLRPNYAEAGVGLAAVLRRLGKLRESEHLLRGVLRHKPDSAEAHISLGICLVKERRVEEAIGHFEEALRLNPDLTLAHSNLGNALAEQGESAKAVEHYRTALGITPGDTTVLFNLGCILVRQGEPDEAIATFRHTLRIDPGFVRARSELGSLLIARNRYPEALDLLWQAHRDVPRDTSVANDLAWMLATCARPELRNGPEAVRLAAGACQATDNREANFLDTLAAAYAEVGRFEEALATARQALQLARRTGADEFAAQIVARLDLYEHRQPYHEP